LLEVVGVTLCVVLVGILGVSKGFVEIDGADSAKGLYDIKVSVNRLARAIFL
jgi:hypothetical protein